MKIVAFLSMEDNFVLNGYIQGSFPISEELLTMDIYTIYIKLVSHLFANGSTIRKTVRVVIPECICACYAWPLGGMPHWLELHRQVS